MKKLISSYKYRGKSYLADDLVHIILSAFEEVILSLNVDFISYVPLHIKKLKERGFNQSFILARKLGKEFDKEVPLEALVRIRDTETQTHLTRKERAKNIKGSFLLKNPNIFAAKKVLLIDDVYTTGATVNECSALISQAGASGVYVITAARA